MKLLGRDFLDERLVPELEVDTVQYFDHIRRYLFAQQFARGKVVADIACGSGYGSDILLRAHAQQVFAIDISPNALIYARARWKHIHFLQGDAARLPLGTSTIDTVVS